MPPVSVANPPASPIRTIRALTADDLPELSRLWDLTYYKRDGQRLPKLEQYLDAIYFKAPSQTNGYTSGLVAEADDGSIAGFLGCHPRKFVFDGREIIAAACGQLMLHPDFRGCKLSYELCRRFYAGQQEFSFHTTASRSRRMHRALGAHNPPFYGLGWSSPLRPINLKVRRLAGSRRLGPARHLLAPFCKRKSASESVFDACAIDLDEVRSIHETVHEQSRLHAAFDAEELAWKLDLIRASSRRSGFARLVRDGPCAVGFNVWVVQRDGTAVALETLAVPGSQARVLQCLLDDALKSGATSIRGYCADESDALAAQQVGASLLYQQSTSILHSRNDELLHEFLNNPPRIAVLDGEGWFEFPRD